MYLPEANKDPVVNLAWLLPTEFNSGFLATHLSDWLSTSPGNTFQPRLAFRNTVHELHKGTGLYE